METCQAAAHFAGTKFTLIVTYPRNELVYIYIIYWGVPELVGLLVIVGDPVFGLSHVYWRNTSVSS